MINVIDKYSSFFRQSAYTLVIRIILMLLGFATSVLTARLLGPSGKGMLSLLVSVQAIILPIGTLGIKQSASYFSGKKIFSEQKMLSNILGIFLIMSVLLVIITFLIYKILNYDELYDLLTIIIFSIIIAFVIFKDYLNFINIVRKNIKFLNNQTLIFAIGYLAIIIMFSLMGNLNIKQIGIANILSNTIVISLIIIYIIKTVKLTIRIHLDKMKPLIMKGLMFSLSLIILQLNYRFDIIMLGKMTNTEIVGIYSVGVHICELLNKIPLSIGLVLFTRAINWEHNSKNIYKLKILLRYTVSSVVILGIILLGTAHKLIPILYGYEYFQSVYVIWSIILGVIVLSIFHIIHLYIAADGKPYYAIFAFAPALIINIILNLILIPKYTFIGAGIASTLSYIIGTICFLIIITLNYDVSIKELI